LKLLWPKALRLNPHRRIRSGSVQPDCMRNFTTLNSAYNLKCYIFLEMDMDKNTMLSLLSLVVAALAVLFGPIISWIIAKRHSSSSQKNVLMQTEASLRIANKQVVAPMRQAWINSLRDLIAELTGKCAHFWAAGFEKRRDEEYQRIAELEYKLALFINPKEDDHKKLLDKARLMVAFLETGKEADENFWQSHKGIIELSQQILKKEWNRVKEEI